MSPAADGSEPVEDDEILYRRVLEFHYSPSNNHLSPHAFRPTERDKTGLSVYRAKYKSIEEASRGREGKAYFVAVLRAGDLRKAGIEVVPRPTVDDPGHSELPSLTYDNRRSDAAEERQVMLSQKLRCGIRGPFRDGRPTSSDPTVE